MTCFYCRGKMVEGTTVLTVQLDNCLVVIKNVPCHECSQCGEVEVSDEVMRELERIVSSYQAPMQEIAVLNYQKAA